MKGKKTGQNEETAAGEAGFYEKVLDEAEKVDFTSVRGQCSVDDEIALLRVKIKSLVRDHPEDTRLLLKTAEILTKMVMTRYRMNKEQKKGFKEAVQTVIKEIAVPLGVAAISKKL